MKAGTVAEKAVCESCGAGVRDASSFCYNCGESIPATPGSVISGMSALAASINGLTTEKAPSSDIDVLVSADEPIEGKIVADTEPLIDERTNVQSAASLRRRAKAYNRKPVEIVWVERQGSSTAFIVVSIVLVVFTAVLLAFAMYLK